MVEIRDRISFKGKTIYFGLFFLGVVFFVVIETTSIRHSTGVNETKKLYHINTKKSVSNVEKNLSWLPHKQFL